MTRFNEEVIVKVLAVYSIGIFLNIRAYANVYSLIKGTVRGRLKGRKS